MPSHGALTLFFRWRKKSVQKKASGTATPKAAHVAMHCGQALRCAWAWLRASWLSAISGASRPSASLGRGLRPAVAPSGLSSGTGCPVSHSSLPVALLASHPPCGSLWAAPKAPLGPRFPSGQFAALTRRKKASIAHFDGGARNIARNGVGQLSPAFGVRSCSPFPLSKWADLFPSAAYRRSAPPQLALTRLNQCELGYYIITWRTSQRRKTRFDFSFAHDTIHTQITPLGMFRRGLNFFTTQNASVSFYPRWHF